MFIQWCTDPPYPYALICTYFLFPHIVLKLIINDSFITCYKSFTLPMITMFFYPISLLSILWDLDFSGAPEIFGPSRSLTLPWYYSSKKQKQRHSLNTEIMIKTIRNNDVALQHLLLYFFQDWAVPIPIPDPICPSQLFLAFCLPRTLFISQEIMGFLASAAICLMLAYCKTHTFLALKSNFPLPIIASVGDVLLSAVCCIFLTCVNRILASSSFSMLQLRWLCKCLGFGQQTHTLS